MNYEIFIKIIFLFLLAIIPSLVWLAFFLQRDPRPEPRRFILLSFIIGGIMAIIASQAENKWFVGLVQNNVNIQAGTLLLLFFYPFLEEIFKFIASRISTIKNKYFLDEKTDPMVYMISAALGFAAFENLKIFFAIVFGADIPDFLGMTNFDISQTMMITLLSTAFLRFISTVLMHALSSAILGYFWAMKRLTKQKTKMMLIAMPTGLIIATVVHTIFNYVILEVMGNIIFIVPLLLALIIVALIVRRCFNKLITA